MSEKTTVEYKISEHSVKVHAPIVYHMIKDMYHKVGEVITLLNADSKTQGIIRENTMVFDFLYGESIEYEDAFLENDDFRTAVIYHLGLSNIFERIITWEEYIQTMNTIQRAFVYVKDIKGSIDTYILNKFSVNPEAIPKKYLSRMMKINEYNSAVDLISKKVSKLPEFLGKKGDTEDYDEYFDQISKLLIPIVRRV